MDAQRISMFYNWIVYIAHLFPGVRVTADQFNAVTREWIEQGRDPREVMAEVGLPPHPDWGSETPTQPTIVPGDIIQIDPAHDERFGGCLLMVDDVKSWGVQAFIQIPAGGRAFYRARFDRFEVVGHAAWIPAPAEGEEEGEDGTP